MKRTLAVFSLVFAIALTATSQTPNPQQPEKLGKKQLAALVSNAKTPADHTRLASYYAAQAQTDLTQARTHGQMAATFQQSSPAISAKFDAGTVKHCQYVQAHLQQEAAKMQLLSQQQQLMATAGQ